ncbi:MAG TPA: MFS transporter [Thermomicrobiales bacterium]|nr:MFS transporter [Thermomicrobiales bacterium]
MIARGDQQIAQRATLKLLIAAIFVVSIDSRVITPILPAIADDLGVTIGRAGLIVTAYLLPYGLFQLFYGPLADRKGHVRVICFALFGFAIGEALCALSPGLPALVGFRLLTGMVAAAIFPLVLAWIGETVDYTHRQSIIGYTVMAASIGQVLSAAAGGFMAAVVSWRTIFVLDGMLALVIAVMMLRAGLPRHEPVVAGDRSRLSPYRTVLDDPRHILFLALVFVEGALTIGAFSYFGALLRARDGYSYLAIGFFIALFGLTSVAMGRFIGRAARVLGERRMIAVGGIGVVLAYLMTTLQPSLVVFPLAMLLCGATFTLMHSTLQTRATELAPAARATSISLFAFALFLGSSVGALVAAQAIDRYGYNPTMIGLGAGMALVAVVATARAITWSQPGRIQTEHHLTNNEAANRGGS